MALTYSNMMELGTIAPDFKLLDTQTGSYHSLRTKNPTEGSVVFFICNHCPFVHHINRELVRVAAKYQDKGIQFLAISSNDIHTYPQDAPEFMTQVAKKERYPFPYLFDESQEVAKAYGAECTPDFFVFNSAYQCVYRGRFDETRPNMGIPNGKDLTRALDALLDNHPVNPEQHPSMGCGIKWK